MLSGGCVGIPSTSKQYLRLFHRLSTDVACRYKIGLSVRSSIMCMVARRKSEAKSFIVLYALVSPESDTVRWSRKERV